MKFEARKNPRKSHCSHIFEYLSGAWTFGIRMVEISIIFGNITKEILALFHIREVTCPALVGVQLYGGRVGTKASHLVTQTNLFSLLASHNLHTHQHLSIVSI